jgi:predicted transcriptional regulator
MRLAIRSREVDVAGLGHLERAVMQALWDADAPLSAYDVLPLVAGAASGKRHAATTVLTVLSRLEK